MQNFFVSDMHFGHTNCIKYCERPFKDAGEMDKAIIDNWNSVVELDDHVYVLGDVSFLPLTHTLMRLDALNGVMHLIAGNHDHKNRKHSKFCDQFAWVKDYFELTLFESNNKDNKQHIVMCHYPILNWNRKHYGSFMLHGHSHGKTDNEGVFRYDVGVDNNNFTPISYQQIKKRLGL